MKRISVYILIVVLGSTLGLINGGWSISHIYLNINVINQNK